MFPQRRDVESLDAGRTDRPLRLALIAGLLADLLLAVAILLAHGSRSTTTAPHTHAGIDWANPLFLVSVVVGSISTLATAIGLIRVKNKKWQAMSVAGVIAYWAAFVCVVITGAI